GWADDNSSAFTTEGRTAKQNDAFKYLQNLLQWRQNSEVIHTGLFKHFVPENNTYIYFRYNKDECILVAFNNSPNEMKAIKTDRFAECMKDYKYAINIITGENINYLDALTLPPKSTVVLELKK
ncbi:MAG: cyclomaltodextrinase C-terminal domain-containing protein, partial [Bacteroidales bacterium]|nr:cyclomaltodextrinase C-terminal domain-containing protein [Bacteroidales bacterium]